VKTNGPAWHPNFDPLTVRHDTDFHEFEGRGHSLTIDHGWTDVADTALQWLSSKEL
jgi:hypothetical protein